jgi:hypothetical protein
MSEKSSEIEKEESENPKIENIVEEHKEGVEEIKNSEIQVPSEEKASSIEAETKPDTDNTVEFSNEADPELISGTTDDKKPELAAGPKKIISKKDYKSFTPEELIDELKSLIESNPIQKIKNQVEEIRSEFNKAFKAKKKDDQEDFIKNGGDKDDYKFNSPLKKEFNLVFKDYKEKRSIYYQDLSKDLKANLEKRLALIEELKSLLNVEENINSTYKHFKEIQERWFEC